MNHKADTLETRMQALNARAATQRERFLGTLDVLRQQAHPARLKEHAGNRLLDRMLNALSRGRSAVTMHPARALGIAALAGAVLAHRPVLTLAAKAYRAGKRIALEKYQEYRMARGPEETHE